MCMQETTSGAWHQGQLYVATPAAVHCVFVVPNPHASAPLLEARTLIPCPVKPLHISLC